MNKLFFTSVCLALLLLSATSFAKLYLAPPAGQGDLFVGPGGDYPTLKAAADDINASPPTGDVAIIITGDFAEPQNFALGQATGPHTITVRPAPGVTPTVTFTDISDNLGFPGGFIIGVNQIEDLDNGFYQMNVIIDGSNNGSKSRDLTFIFPSDFSVYPDPQASWSGVSPVGIHVIGTKGTILKNFNVDFLVVGRSLSIYAIRLTARRRSEPFDDDWLPDNTTLSNLDVYAHGSYRSHGVGALSWGTIKGEQKAIYSTIIEDCVIEGQSRGILFICNAGFILRRNTLRCDHTGPVSGLMVTPFMHVGSNADPSIWTAIIENNIFDKIHSVESATRYGIAGIQLTGTPASPGRKYIVRNNVWKNFALTAPEGSDLVYRCIETESSESLMEIYNNTIYMPAIPNVSSATPGNVAAIAATNSYGSNTFTMKNNLIIFQQTNGNACVIYKHNGEVQIPLSDKNNYVSPLTSTGTFAIVGQSRTNVTFAAWRLPPYSQDASSITLDCTSLLADDRFHWRPLANVLPFAIGDTGGHIPVADIDGALRGPAPIVGAVEGNLADMATSSSLNFGIVNIGDSATLCLDISNLGYQTLTLAGASFRGADAVSFGLNPNITFPIHIPSYGSSSVVCVDFMPRRHGAIEAEMTIESNDSDNPAADVNVRGRGRFLCDSWILR